MLPEKFTLRELLSLQHIICCWSLAHRCGSIQGSGVTIWARIKKTLQPTDMRLPEESQKYTRSFPRSELREGDAANWQKELYWPGRTRPHAGEAGNCTGQVRILSCMLLSSCLCCLYRRVHAVKVRTTNGNALPGGPRFSPGGKVVSKTFDRGQRS